MMGGWELKLIISYIRRHLLGFCIAILFLVIESFCDLMQPMMMSRIVDDAVAHQDTALILRLGGIMLIIALVGAIGAVGRNYFAGHISQTIGKEMRSDLYRKIQTFSFENIDHLETASLITRITNDVAQIQNFINGCMRILVKAPIICIGAIGFIIVQTPAQMPVVFCILIIAMGLIIWNMKLGYPRFRKVQTKLDELNNVSRSYLMLVRVVKAFGQEEQEQERFGQVADDLALSNQEAMRVNAIFNPLISLTVNMGIVILLWAAGYQGGTIEIGKLMASINYMTQVLFALGMVSNILNSMIRANASASRVKEVLEEVPAMTETMENKEIDLASGISFKNVKFNYPSAEQNTLEHITFHIPKGKTCGIIGSTGSGKTTLMQLLLRFYDATSGEIKIGNEEIKEIKLKTLREKMALVSQKPLLFSGTIENNLRWGHPNVSEEKLKEAIRISQSEAFISTLDQGVQTVLGQGGVNLSGGQKQRLSLARALVKNPEILILDDCTSALDATTEAKVLQGISNYAKDMTTFLITQRISTVMKADYILCLDHGILVGQGTHKELMNTCCVYQEIYESQIGGEVLG